MAYSKRYTIDFGAEGTTVHDGVQYCDYSIDDLFTDLNTHEALTTSCHGVGTGVIVSTIGSQSLCNKTLVSPVSTGGTFTNPTLTGTVTIQGPDITSGTLTNPTLVNPTISGGTITGTITNTGGTISGGTISGATISAPTLTGVITATGATLVNPTVTGGTLTNPTLTGEIAASGATISGPTITGATISGATITGGSITNAVGAVPAGSMVLWTTDTPPTGWLLCYGQEVSRTTYADLFAVISTTFGTGDGSTTFNLPDLRGRFPLGQDDMGGSSANRVTASQADSLGGASGAETHTLTIAEMPSHTHTESGWSEEYGYMGPGSGYPATVNTGATGGGGAHNNMPPYLTVNYIIKY